MEHEAQQFPYKQLRKHLFPSAELGVLSDKQYLVSRHLKKMLEALQYSAIASKRYLIFAALAAIQHTKFPFMELVCSPCVHVCVCVGGWVVGVSRVGSEC